MIEAGMKHTLIESDQEIIRKMAQEISDQGRSYFVNNLKRNNVSLYETELEGFGAEMAFCRMVGSFFNRTTNENEDYSIKYDCVLPDGRTVDIKNTKYTNGKLLVLFGKERFVVDMYVLMTGVFPSYIFRGWAAYTDIIDQKNIKDLGYGPNYTFEQHQLNKTL